MSWTLGLLAHVTQITCPDGYRPWTVLVCTGCDLDQNVVRQGCQLHDRGGSFDGDEG